MTTHGLCIKRDNTSEKPLRYVQDKNECFVDGEKMDTNTFEKEYITLSELLLNYRKEQIGLMGRTFSRARSLQLDYQKNRNGMYTIALKCENNVYIVFSGYSLVKLRTVVWSILNTKDNNDLLLKHGCAVFYNRVPKIINMECFV